MTSQPKSTAEMYKTLYIVFANAEQIERIESFSYADKFNLKGDDGKQKEALEQIQNEFYEKFLDGTMESRMLSRSSFMNCTADCSLLESIWEVCLLWQRY